MNRRYLDVIIPLDLDLYLEVDIDYFPPERPDYSWEHPSPGSPEIWDVLDAQAVFKTDIGTQRQDVTLLAQAGFFNSYIEDALAESNRLDAEMRAEAQAERWAA